MATQMFIVQLGCNIPEAYQMMSRAEVLLSLLFNVDVDEVSLKLNHSNICYHFNGVKHTNNWVWTL